MSDRGLVLLPEDEQASGVTMPAILYHDFWRRRYQEDRGVLGRKVLIQGQPFVIVGVLPKGFNGSSIDVSPDVRVPVSAVPMIYAHEQTRPRAENLYYEIVGRLQSGFTLQQARDEAFTLFGSATEADPPMRQESSWAFRLAPIRRGVSRLRTQLSKTVVFLMTVVAVLLLIVCANVSGLLIARFAAREREFTRELGLRLSIGAFRHRILGSLGEPRFHARSGWSGGDAAGLPRPGLRTRGGPALRRVSPIRFGSLSPGFVFRPPTRRNHFD